MSVSRSRWLHRPWFTARFNLQTEHSVCRVYQMVVLVRWLGNVSTHDGQMCLLLRVSPFVLVHGLILPGRRFVSHIFIPSISPAPLSSAFEPRIYHCRIEQSCNFPHREFYPPNFISGNGYRWPHPW